MDGNVNEPTAGSWLAVHAVVRNRRSDRALDALRLRPPARGFQLVETRELAAAVTGVDSPPPAEARPGGGDVDPQALRAHAEVVAHLLRRSSVVPAPFGLHARDEGAVRRFLETQRVPLLEALDFFEDCYEMRLHVHAAGTSGDAARDVARHVYEDLRRGSRAARVLAEREEGRVLSAAFLIARSEWIRSVEQIGDWEAREEVRMDVTGPWAPYDFVRLVGLDGGGGS